MKSPSQRRDEPGLKARRVALSLLQAVVDRKQPLDEALAGEGRLAALSARDRAFARLLVATCLRRLPEVDRLLSGFLSRPLPRKAGEARWALRLGAVQILFLKTPPHAAVATSVALLQGPAQGFKGLVNAVLRRLSREGQPLPGVEAARVNTPDWLWESWRKAYGEGEAAAIAAAHLTEPPLDLIAARDSDLWAERLGAEQLPLGALRLPSGAGDPAEMPGYGEGAWWVQDQAAALPVALFPKLAGQRALDLCAAPGGKTLQMASAGAEVTAIDRSGERLVRLRGNLERCGLSARLVEGDAGEWRPEEPADLVLLDAPCSATGTLRRHPDIARNRSPADIATLLPLQARLLQAAWRMLRPGGILIYSVCSLQPEEGPDQIEALLSSEASLTRRAVAAEEVASLGQLIDAQGDLRCLPSHLAERGGLDGFFAARLERLA